ncbi:MAG TPA: hypothetical protein VHK86_01920 [Nitrososphaera sp.]|jgi:hypothetical protein|nr:hypothetical protein [Nitrososphaera sp.]
MDPTLQELIIKDMECNAAFRAEVRTALGTIQTRFAAEDALKAYRVSTAKTVFAWIGTLVAIAGVALPFFLK